MCIEIGGKGVHAEMFEEAQRRWDQTKKFLLITELRMMKLIRFSPQSVMVCSMRINCLILL